VKKRTRRRKGNREGRWTKGVHLGSHAHEITSFFDWGLLDRTFLGGGGGREERKTEKKKHPTVLRLVGD